MQEWKVSILLPLHPARGDSAKTFRIALGRPMKFVGCYDSKGSLKDLLQSGVHFKTVDFSAKTMAMEEFKAFELMLS